jgi:probable O-glycosylation ligase (exosortase A-associated)
MWTIVLYLILTATFVSSLARPYISVLAYYTLAIWHPQIIWMWIFGRARFAVMVSIGAILGFVISFARGQIDFSILKNKQNAFVAVMWVLILISYMFNPYGINDSPSKNFNTDIIVDSFNKIFLFYFLSVLLIDTKEKLHFLIMVMVVTIIYYIYWANDTYLSGRMFQARLAGPGPGGIYYDENCFAMLFVTGIPFLYFMGGYYQNKLIKYAMWAAIPLAWHAIFLTGSQGGMIGLGAVTLFIAVRSKKKIFMILVPVALVVAFITQGGEFLKERMLRTDGQSSVQTFSEVDQETSTAQQRINAWVAGMRMISKHPLTGVGPCNFFRVYHEFSDTTPHVEHNTFFQFAAETGIVSGLIYLALFFNAFRNYLRSRKLPDNGSITFFEASRDAIIGGLGGFFTCAMFLNLATYEILYYLLILNIAQERCIRDEVASLAAAKPQRE